MPETRSSPAQNPPRYPFEIRASADAASRRLDQFLVAHLPDVSRARIQQVIEQGNVLVNDAQEKPSYKLRAGDTITVLGPAERAPLRAIPEEIPLDIVYEDDDLAVINKPSGMMVHAGAGATEDERNRGTLVNALLHRFATLSNVGGELRPGIVHRLDRETSGLMVVAKNDVAHRKLSEQFSSRVVKKKYLALVHGWPRQDSGTIDASISRDAVRRTRMTTRRTGGRAAVSHWHVLQRLDSPYGKFAFVEVKIDTGRTHQIRVHLSSIGHPVVGDTLYGAPSEIKRQAARRGVSPRRASKTKSTDTSNAAESAVISLPRNFLHSSTIEFEHPTTGTRFSFTRGLPRELDEFMASIAG